MDNKIKQLCENFNIHGNIIGYKPVTHGHINTTLFIRFAQNEKICDYILQKINNHVFNNPEQVMYNIINVTNFIKHKLIQEGENPDRKVLQFMPSTNGNYFVIDENGDYWRLSKYISNSITFNTTDRLDILAQTGKAFGEFQQLLDDYPVKDLKTIIPHFHNTIDRYKIFKSVLNNDPVGRAKHVNPEIDEFLNLENMATKLCRMQAQNKIPSRVTHNDTKCNNVLFDKSSGKYLCVIDLDTIMPGLACFDFGDAVRFATNTCGEDETDLSKVKIDLNKFDALARGYLSKASDSLTSNELQTLSLGAITMTIECGLRFLTDYIDGDNYFKIVYPQHNLDRSRCQLTLAKDMINNYHQMQQIVEKYCKQYSHN